MLDYNKNFKNYSRELRTNLTEAEKNIWVRLRCKQLKNKQFYRQKIIGNYIVDFYCPKAKLVIEIDGGQHYSEAGKKKDGERDKTLKEKGLVILRFSDREVFKNISGVMARIYASL